MAAVFPRSGILFTLFGAAVALLVGVTMGQRPEWSHLFPFIGPSFHGLWRLRVQDSHQAKPPLILRGRDAAGRADSLRYGRAVALSGVGVTTRPARPSPQALSVAGAQEAGGSEHTGVKTGEGPGCAWPAWKRPWPEPGRTGSRGSVVGLHAGRQKQCQPALRNRRVLAITWTQREPARAADAAGRWPSGSGAMSGLTFRPDDRQTP